MKKKIISVVFTLIFPLLLFPGCSHNSSKIVYQDGTYTGKSSEDDQGAYAEVTLIIDDNKITDCNYITWQKDGSVKDENYGKVNGEISNQDYYDKAQLAVNAMEQYAEKLIEVQKLKEVDVIAGATISYDQFTEAVNNALEEAKQ